MIHGFPVIAVGPTSRAHFARNATRDLPKAVQKGGTSAALFGYTLASCVPLYFQLSAAPAFAWKFAKRDCSARISSKPSTTLSAMVAFLMSSYTGTKRSRSCPWRRERAFKFDAYEIASAHVLDVRCPDVIPFFGLCNSTEMGLYFIRRKETFSRVSLCVASSTTSLQKS